MNSTKAKLDRFWSLTIQKYREGGVLNLLKAIPEGIKFLYKQILSESLIIDVKSKLSRYSSKELYYKTRSEKYLERFTEDNEASNLLFKLVNRNIDDTNLSDLSVLEIGCNAGRRANYLHENGIRDLYGIEINDTAIELMDKNFPQLSSDINVTEGRAQDVISKFESNKFDVVYTVSVLMHLDNDVEQLFDEIKRITKPDGLVITMECENSEYVLNKLDLNEDYSDWQKHRNYQEVFEPRGFSQVEQINAWDAGNEAEQLSVLRSHYKNGTHTARVFRNTGSL